jgi:hypothetical protein
MECADPRAREPGTGNREPGTGNREPSMSVTERHDDVDRTPAGMPQRPAGVPFLALPGDPDRKRPTACGSPPILQIVWLAACADCRPSRARPAGANGLGFRRGGAFRALPIVPGVATRSSAVRARSSCDPTVIRPSSHGRSASGRRCRGPFACLRSCSHVRWDGCCGRACAHTSKRSSAAARTGPAQPSKNRRTRTAADDDPESSERSIFGSR